MSKFAFFATGICVLSILPFASVSEASAQASGQRVCGRFSTVVLTADERAEVDGAGQNSVSLMIKGKAGDWIFYDALGSSKPEAGDKMVLKRKGSLAYRRGHDARIYSIVTNPAKPVAGKTVVTAAMGVNFMRQPIANSALKGTDADKAILQRVFPGVLGACDLRWQPGVGLVK